MVAAVIAFSFAACNRGRDASSPAPAISGDAKMNIIDNLLTEYEQFADKYLALSQRMMAGDVSAVFDLEKITSDAEEWVQKWSDFVESDFSQAQLLRLQQIMDKFISTFGL
jgi:hypothetical protein